MTSVFHWGVQSDELAYPSTFGHVPTCVYVSYRPDELLVPKQQKKRYVSAVFCWRKMSDKNLEQWIHIEFCV
jgi:hypothetical protein